MIKKPFVERWHSDAFDNRSIANQIFNDVKKNLKLYHTPNRMEILPQPNA
jgi:hypothetical protein